MESVEKIKIASIIIFIGFFSAIAFHSFFVYYPYNTFLLNSSAIFKDFFDTYDFTAGLNPYFKSRLAVYFPFAFLIFFPFTLLPSAISLLIYNGIFCIFIYCFITYFLKKNLPQERLSGYENIFAMSAFFSYPMLFCLDRSNLENLLFIVFSVFILLFLRKKYFFAALILAVAISMKLYPAVFIVLFIKEKCWKELFYCLLFSACLSLIALASFTQAGIIENVQQFFKVLNGLNNRYIIHDLGLYCSSSLFSLLKIILWALQPDGNKIIYQKILKNILPYYTLGCIMSFAFVSWYIYFVEKILWKQALLLVSVMILFPSISGDYKLIYLFIPFLLFAIAKKEKYDLGYTLIFSLLFIPKNYLIFKGAESYLGLTSVINITLMSLFIAWIIIDGLKNYAVLRQPKCQLLIR